MPSSESRVSASSRQRQHAGPRGGESPAPAAGRRAGGRSGPRRRLLLAGHRTPARRGSGTARPAGAAAAGRGPRVRRARSSGPDVEAPARPGRSGQVPAGDDDLDRRRAGEQGLDRSRCRPRSWCSALSIISSAGPRSQMIDDLAHGGLRRAVDAEGPGQRRQHRLRRRPAARPAASARRPDSRRARRDAYATAIRVLPTPAGPTMVISRRRAVDQLGAARRVRLPGRRARRGRPAAPAWPVRRSAPWRRAPAGRPPAVAMASASSRIVVIRGDRRPRSSRETASGLSPGPRRQGLLGKAGPSPQPTELVAEQAQFPLPP